MGHYDREDEGQWELNRQPSDKHVKIEDLIEASPRLQVEQDVLIFDNAVDNLVRSELLTSDLSLLKASLKKLLDKLEK